MNRGAENPLEPGVFIDYLYGAAAGSVMSTGGVLIHEFREPEMVEERTLTTVMDQSGRLVDQLRSVVVAEKGLLIGWRGGYYGIALYTMSVTALNPPSLIKYHGFRFNPAEKATFTLRGLFTQETKPNGCDIVSTEGGILMRIGLNSLNMPSTGNTFARADGILADLVKTIVSTN